ncbi:unnamed protein product [Porites evermanni]|uniref:Uncharacterized protein n=1 Tax=Porites evermanni TaxID=104178 RepID=A0ABN8SKA9_9CNID|nr:unnamed protein product [Porites evermanni]
MTAEHLDKDDDDDFDDYKDDEWDIWDVYDNWYNGDYYDFWGDVDDCDDFDPDLYEKIKTYDRRRTGKEGKISAITDGEEYHKHVPSGFLANPNNISLSFNTDCGCGCGCGVPQL